jgi:hypothetical protein
MTFQNKKYCPRIYHGLTLSGISDTEISYSVCCWGDPIKGTNIDFYNKDLTQLRNINQDGELPLPYCNKCNAQEQANKKSMRLGYVEMHELESYKPGVQYLDINIDYTCNLACVTCGPALSTTWRNELKIKGTNVRPHIDNFIKNKISTLDLTQLKEIRLWGGEPFLTNTHKDILQYVVERGNAHDIKLMYNTNGTQLIDDETKKLIEQFKFARISFSIDGIGEKFNYLRYRGNWQQVEQNLIWWKNNLPHNSMLALTVTASILNVLDLDQVHKWHQSTFNQSIFGDPIEVYVHQAFGDYGLEFMPTRMIDHLKSLTDYKESWIQNLNILGTQQDKLANTLTQLQQVDIRRNLDFSKISPVTADLLGYQK